MQLANFLLQDFLEDGNRARVQEVSNAARQLVQRLLGDDSLTAPVYEASVHRSKRSRVWNAVFTGSSGGQLSRTTGLTDRDQALLVARRWEAEAADERAKLGHTPKKRRWRVRRPEPGTGAGPLTQREIALLLHMSERAVREVERRALKKLFDDPLLRQVWKQYLAGELDEDQLVLTPQEIAALFALAQTPAERNVIRKLLALTQLPRPPFR
jgi:hypothetical protein